MSLNSQESIPSTDVSPVDGCNSSATELSTSADRSEIIVTRNSEQVNKYSQNLAHTRSMRCDCDGCEDYSALSNNCPTFKWSNIINDQLTLKSAKNASFSLSFIQ